MNFYLLFTAKKSWLDNFHWRFPLNLLGREKFYRRCQFNPPSQKLLGFILFDLFFSIILPVAQCLTSLMDESLAFLKSLPAASNGDQQNSLWVAALYSIPPFLNQMLAVRQIFIPWWFLASNFMETFDDKYQPRVSFSTILCRNTWLTHHFT